MKVQVVYALPETQTVIALELPEGATLEAAIQQSKICEKHSEINLETQKVGIYGEIVPRDTVLRDGDRVEIYRPLFLTPMEARRLRASKGSKSYPK